MNGLSSVADVLAVVMLATAATCAVRIAVAWIWRLPGDTEVNVAHVVMGVAMAGMLVKSLYVFTGAVWVVVFAALTAWFGWRIARDLSRHEVADLRDNHYGPHFLHGGAMIYMVAAVPAAGAATASQHGMSGMPGMPGMSGGGSGSTTWPLLAIVFALFMVAYAVWVLDRFPVWTSHAGGLGVGAPPAARILLSSRVAAACELALSITMAYMLITAL